MKPGNHIWAPSKGSKKLCVNLGRTFLSSPGHLVHTDSRLLFFLSYFYILFYFIFIQGFSV